MEAQRGIISPFWHSLPREFVSSLVSLTAFLIEDLRRRDPFPESRLFHLDLL